MSVEPDKRSKKDDEEILETDGEQESFEPEILGADEDLSPAVEHGPPVPITGAGDPLAAYLKQVSEHQLLTPDEEVQLARSFRDEGDLDAAYRLTTSNLRLVIKIAFELNRTKMDVLDLIQEGNLGLMRAVQKYDPERGIRFASYAVWWIKGYIYKYILDNWKMVKIGTTQNQRKLFFSLRKEEERLRQLGFAPTPKLIADGMGVRESEVAEMQKRLSSRDYSLDAPVSPDSDTEPMDMLSDEAPSFDSQMVKEEFDDQIRMHMRDFGETLKDRDKMIYMERMLSDEPITLQDIGDRLGITRERARQLEVRIKRNLKAHLEENMPDISDIDFSAGE